MKATLWTKEMIDYYTSKGVWTSETWPDIYDRNARIFPDREAFVDYRNGKRRAVTWAEIKKYIDRLALGLIELGLNRDDRVICQLPPCIEHIVVKVALEKAGLIFGLSPINTWEAENDRFLQGLEAVAVVTVPEYRGRNHFEFFQRLRDCGRHPYFKHIFLVGDEIPKGELSINKIMKTPLEEKYPANFLDDKKVSAYEVSFVYTTTGTTGLPKMAEMPTNSNRTHGAIHFEKMGVCVDDIGFSIGPLWSGPTAVCVLVLPQVGGKVILMEKFDAGEALQIIERERPTYLGCFPSQAIDLVRHPDFAKYDKSSLRFIKTGGAPFPPGFAKECEDKFQRPFVSGLGSGDSAMMFMPHPEDPQDVRLGSVGKPSQWDEYKVVKEDGSLAGVGEIGILHWRGPGCTSGYYQDSGYTKKMWGNLGLEGWCNTEDRAYQDKNGNVWLVGRSQDVIDRGGQNVFPGEIESILSKHPKLAGVQIVPMPDSKLGERACAYAILQKGETFTLKEMVSYLQEKKLALYKLPERLEIIDKFPILGDKINKRELALDICQKLLKEGKIDKNAAEGFEKKRKLAAK